MKDNYKVPSGEQHNVAETKDNVIYELFGLSSAI